MRAWGGEGGGKVRRGGPAGAGGGMAAAAGVEVGGGEVAGAPAGGAEGVAYQGGAARMAAWARGGEVGVFRRDAGRAGGWAREGGFLVQGGVADCAWAPREAGTVLATAGPGGELSFWGPSGADGEWASVAPPLEVAPCGGASLRCVRFAPASQGLAAAVAGEDGCIAVCRADGFRADATWRVEGRFQAMPGSAAVSLAWRPYGGEGVPPMLLVGTTKGAAVWMFDAVLGKWTAAGSVPLTAEACVEDVDWAPAVGRACETVAIAVSNWALILRVAGDPGALNIEKCAEFEHPAAVHQVEWNLSGTTLASTAGDGVARLWKENALGEWGEVAHVIGQ